MPVYEYECLECGSRFAKLQPMSAPREGNECPCCGGRQSRRVISRVAALNRENGSSCGPGAGAIR